MRIEFMTVAYQIYLIPTVKVTNDRILYGYKNVELWWLKWGIEIIY